MCDFCETIYDEEYYFAFDPMTLFWDCMDGIVRRKNGTFEYHYNADDPCYSTVIGGFKYCPRCGKELK